jgi:hypothetical protein
MEGKKSFVLYSDLIYQVKKMPIESVGKLFITLLEYVNDENPDVSDDLIVDLVFEGIKQDLKRDLKKWDEKKQLRAEAGKKGGEAKSSNAKQGLANVANASFATTSLANVAVNGNVNVNGNGNVNDNVISSIDIITYRKFGGKNLVEELMHINDLAEEQILKLHSEWQLTHDESEFETEKHLKNSFILFVKNNAFRFKETKGRAYKKISEPPKENVFAKLLREEIEKENQQKQ